VTDQLQKWRESHAKQDARVAEETKKRKSVEQRERRLFQVEALRNEITTLRADMQYRENVHVEALGEVIAGLQHDVADQVEKVLTDMRAQYRGLEADLFRLVERKFGELMGRLDAAGVPSRKGDVFRFASEKNDDDPVELPNPLKGLN
jgi:hypothetical protein